MARRNFLEHVNFAEIQHLGMLEAEKDDRLESYYIGREQFLDRALNLNDPASVFVGPKGIGKSAILQMIRLERAADKKRVIDISPDDLAFTALANIEQQSPLLDDAAKHQHLYKTLWDYVLTVEIAKREFKTKPRIVEFFLKYGANYDKRAMRRLLDRTLDDEGKDIPLSARILALVSEVEASFSAGSVGAKGKFVANSSSNGPSRQLTFLSLINEAVKAMVNENVIKTPYYVLIDDLDLYYRGTEIQNSFLGALLLSVRRLSRSKHLKFAVSLRDYIFEAIPIAEKDKFRDSVCVVEWEDRHVKKMVQTRISILLGCAEEIIWRDIFPPNAFATLLKFTNGVPRELLRLCSKVLSAAKKHEHSTVTKADMEEGTVEFSKEQLGNLASEFVASHRGLQHVARYFRRCDREFDYDVLLEVAFEVAHDAETKDRYGADFQWALGAFDNAAAFAHELLTIGLLHIKDGRKGHPRAFDRDTDRVSEETWFAIPTVLQPALGMN